MSSFTHIDDKGRVRMVDVTDKKPTHRTARAQAVVHMQPETLTKINTRRVKKGNVLETARIAGVMAAKKTSDLIPMCHPLNITHAQIDFYPMESGDAVTHGQIVKKRRFPPVSMGIRYRMYRHFVAESVLEITRVFR